jgi:hypothetical protein
MSSGVNSGSTTIPLDDTIPQITEGHEYMSLAITPKSTTNNLLIDVNIYCSASAGVDIIGALFQDATSNALAAMAVFQGTGTGRVNIHITHFMAAGTTSGTTFRVRIGASSPATITFNGSSTARQLGAVNKSSITITEIAV